MTHDKFCYYSDPKNAGVWDGKDECEDCRRLARVRKDERNEVVSQIVLDFINSDYRNPHYTTDFVGYVTPQPSQLGEQT